ncbi:hypothetical protein PTTG_07222 [Puccinia triticina 1-1 BBBD Race 1]|uniref:Uncharacterized protein n=1 Tax=Puccinia triticina (isolate 1-1 / race 1 (BBBD)) TaxID=630390 RepID=A0A180GYA4_PUCT1|nr:hypothetical protein PTTG_07222 [Puccinia triticina 1-1 BBBD Race 1]
MYPLSFMTSASPAAADASSSCNPPSSSPSPNQLPNYLDRNTIATLLQPHLILLSLQDSRLSLTQPIILSTSCYHSINQIIDQLIYSILSSISANQQSSPSSESRSHLHQTTDDEPDSNPLISLPIEPGYLKTHGILKVLNRPLAQRSIQAAEVGWMVYQNKLNSRQQTQPFPSDYSPAQAPLQPSSHPPPIELMTQSISLSDLFLQLQIDCQILSPYTSHQPWLRANNGRTAQAEPSETSDDHINPHLNQPSAHLFNQSLDLLLDPYYYDSLLERYDSLYHTVNLPLRQHQQLVNQQQQQQHHQQQQQLQHQLHPHQLPWLQAKKAQTTILEDRLVIYFLGVIQAFTNYLLEVIIAIVQTRLPYPSAIQAHHLVGFMAQDDQIINFLSILETIQAKSSLFPHSPLSPFCLVEPGSHHQKSSSLKPLMLTPTMINKLGPASHFLNQIPQPASSSSASLTPLHSPFLPVSPRSRLQTSSLGNRGTVSGARLEQITSDSNIPFQSFHSFSPPPASARRVVSHRSLNSIPTRSSVPNTPHIDYPSPDLSLHPLPSTRTFPSSSTHSVINTATSECDPEHPSLNPHQSSLSHPTQSPLESSPAGSAHPSENQATYRSVTIKRAPPRSKTRKPVPGGKTLTPTPPIAFPDGSHDPVWRPPRGGNTVDIVEDHHGDDSQKGYEIGLPNSTSDSGRLASLPYRSPLSTSSSSITSPRSTRHTPLNPAGHHRHHQRLESQIVANSTTMRHPAELALPHYRSKSLTVATSPVLGQAAENSSHALTEQVNQRPKSVKSHKKGHSVAQPAGLSTRMSFEQLMRSNETVKFSLTPGPCLESSDSPTSRHSSDSLCSPDKSERILSDPIEMVSPKSQASSKLFPRSENLPRYRYQSQSADTPPQLPDFRKFEDQLISSPSSNISSSQSIYSQNNASPPGSLSSKTKLSSHLSSMSQRIAASRTPDLNIPGDVVRKQPQLQSLAEILNSDPPWLAGPKSKKSITKDPQTAELAHMVGALGLSTPKLVRSETLDAKQFHPKASTTSTGSDSMKSQRATQPTKSFDGSNSHQSPVRPQPSEQTPVPSGLQKKLRGFKSLISRRTRVKEEPMPMPSLPALVYSQSKAVETDSSTGSFSESGDLSVPTNHPNPTRDLNRDESALDQPNESSGLDQPNKSSGRLDELGAHGLSRISHSEGIAPRRKPYPKFDVPSNGSPVRPTAQPGFTEDITIAGSAQKNRSKLRRSISLSSLVRRPPARDLEGPGHSQTLNRARSKKSKSRTLTENSNSSGTSRGTITDERGVQKIVPEDQENRSDLDEIMALASRLNRRFRGSFDQRRAGSFDSLPEGKPRFASKQRERQETGSSVEDNFEISFAQELKPTMVNRIIFTSPTKKNPTYRSDDNLLQSYYDSSSQSTAIDEEGMGMNFKEFLLEKSDRSQKSSRGPEDEADDRGTREKTDEPEKGEDENRDEYISLEGLHHMISKLNAIVDQLSKPTPVGQQQDSRTTNNPITGLGIKRVDLLKMMIDQV